MIPEVHAGLDVPFDEFLAIFPHEEGQVDHSVLSTAISPIRTLQFAQLT